MAAVLKAHMGGIPVTADNGDAFYAFIFKEKPELKAFFALSDFKEQGLKTLTAVKSCVDTFGDDAAFKAYMAELMGKHKGPKFANLTAAHFDAFFKLWCTYTKANAEQQAAWQALSAKFVAEAKANGIN